MQKLSDKEIIDTISENPYMQFFLGLKEFHARNHVEGKFGQAKRGYNMNNIQARRKDTSESWVSCIIFVLNIIQLQKIQYSKNI